MPRTTSAIKHVQTRRKRLARKRRRHSPHPPTGQHRPAAHAGISRPYVKALNDLIQLVADTVCGYPNVWGVYSRPLPRPGEIVVVATPPVTRMVQYLLDSLEHHPSALACSCKMSCQTTLGDATGFDCIYRRFD